MGRVGEGTLSFPFILFRYLVFSPFPFIIKTKKAAEGQVLGVKGRPCGGVILSSKLDVKARPKPREAVPDPSEQRGLFQGNPNLVSTVK